MIDAGFVEKTMQDRSVEDRAVKKLVTGQAVSFTGYLRFPEAPGWLTPAANRDKRLWFVRDHVAIASTLGWGRGCAVLCRSRAAGARERHSRPGPLDVHLKDDHLQYAITWFTLAGAVLVAFAVWARGRRRGRAT